MLDSFFLQPPLELIAQYHSSYDTRMVVVSILIAIVAATSSFEMVERLARSDQRRFWLFIGSVILGGGVWAMHFIGMLAFRLDSEITYDAWISLCSVFPGICAAAVTLNTVSQPKVTVKRLVISGTVMAAGIGLMHYVGMAAIRLDGLLRYDPLFFVFSLAAAVCLAVTALLIKAFLAQFTGLRMPFIASLAGGTVLGGAISSMHYIAMEAAHFLHSDANGAEWSEKATSPVVLAITVSSVAILLILSGLAFTYLGIRITRMRAQIRAILASTSQGFLLMDRQGRVTDCNQAMLSLLNSDKQSLLGQNYGDLLDPGPGSPLTGDYQIEARLKRVDGTLIPCLIHGNSLNNDRGEIVNLFALFSDISKRIEIENRLRQREIALAKSEMKFRTLYGSTSEAVMLLDKDGFFDCNQAALNLFGCKSLEEFCTKWPSDLSPPTQPGGEDSLGCASRMMDKAFLQGNHRFEWLHQRADNGQTFSADVVLSALELDGRQVLLATVRDITERKRYEEKLIQLAEMKKQLLQSEKMATLGQLAAGVAHEINNPIGFVYSNLGSLKSYVEDIFEVVACCEASLEADRRADLDGFKAAKDFDYLKSDVFELLKESKDGLSRVKKIVLDLKEFSREGEADVWQLADLHKGIDSTLGIVWNDLKYKCTVTKKYCPDLPQVYCLISQLNQVFMNLLVNAGQSIEQKGEITITTQRCPTNDDAVQILISDTGSGIDAENLPRIFEPFFTTKAAGKGTGLGLAIVSSIVTKHHGGIEVSSAVGTGTTFTITLPIDQGKQDGFA